MPICFIHRKKVKRLRSKFLRLSTKNIASIDETKVEFIAKLKKIYCVI